MQTKAPAFFAALPAHSAVKAAKKQLDLLASRQYGLLERSQVLALVQSEAFIDNQLRQGRWILRFPEVYLVAGVPWSYEQDLMAALLAAGSGSIVSHRSALWLRDIGPRRLDVVEITVPESQHIRLPGVVIRRSRDVHRAEVSLVRRIRVTNPLRALVDVGAALPRDQVESLAREAVGKKLVTWPALAAEVDRLAGRGRRGVGVMRSILDSYNVTNRITPSELEVRALALFERLGVTPPKCEVVWGKEGEWRLDFYWPALRIVIEVDGWSVHASDTSRRRDHRKQNRVTIDGNMVLRYDWFDVVKDYKRTGRTPRGVRFPFFGALTALCAGNAAKNGQEAGRFSQRRNRRRGMVAASRYSWARARKPGGGAGSSMCVMNMLALASMFT